MTGLWFKESSEFDGLHRCSRCHEWKLASEFHNSSDGEYTYCRDCRNAYDRAYYAAGGKVPRAKRRRAAIDVELQWMNSLKAGIACADCGGTVPLFVMHWDHLPEFEKIDDIGSMVGRRSREVILSELDKCQLVCANCHVMRTVQRARKA